MSEENPQETTETTNQDTTTNTKDENENLQHQNGTKIETIDEDNPLESPPNTTNNNNNEETKEDDDKKKELERIDKDKEIEKVKRELKNSNGLANVSKDMVKRKSRNHRQSQEQRRSSIIMRNDKAGFANRIKKLPRTDRQIFLQKRQDIILDILRYLHLGIEVFNTICESDEFLDDNQLDQLPVFWFKQHDWKAWQIHFFYDAIVSSRNRDALSEEIDSCFHKKKRKRKRGRKKNLNPLKHVRRGSVTMLKAMSGNVRRQNKSMLFRVENSRKSYLPLAQGIWNKFVIGRGGRDECKELNAAQWNIQLNDSNIIVDPDLSFELYIFLLDTKEKYDEQHDEDKMLQNYSVFNGTNEHIKKYIQTQNIKNDEEETVKNENLTQHEKDLIKLKQEKIQRKRMKKTPLTEEHFIAMYVKVREVLDSKHGRKFEKMKPSRLDKAIRDLVIFKKIFEALLDGQKFDVQEEYLTQKLTEKELSKSKFVLKQLSSRKSDWRHRLAILEYVEENLEKPNKFHSLLSDENFKTFIFGWTAQMLDDRSQLSSTAVTLFPSVLGTLITKKDSAYLFFEDNLLTHVFGGIFTVLRGRRAKELSQFAEDCAVRVIDIFGNLAEGGEEELANWGRSRSVTLGPNETKFLNIDSPMNSPPISPTSRKDMQFMLDKLNDLSNGNNKMNNLNLKKPKNLTNTGTQTPNRNPGLKKKISLKISTDDTKSPQPLTRTRGRSVKSPTIAKLASQFETEFPDTKENGNSGTKTPTRRKRGSVHVRGKKKSKVVKKKTPISKDVYMDLIEICLKHSTYKIEKHEKVRAATMTMASFLIYGIDNPILESDNTSTNSKDDKDDEKSSKENKKKEDENLKPNKTPSRAFLMSIDPFVQKLKLLVSNGVSDRGESVRLRCMNFIKSLEKTFGSQKMDDLLDKEVMYKYKKWEKRQNYNKEKNKKSKKNNKKNSRNANRMKMARMRAQAMKKKKLEQQKLKKQKEQEQNNTDDKKDENNNTQTNNDDENTG